MIGHNHIGKNGRFGNQMFQYAATRGIAAARGYDFIIPDGPKTDDEFYDEEQQHKLFMAFKMSGLKNVGMLDAGYKQESSFRYDKELVKRCPDNINLYGYFQSERYFFHIEEELRKDFSWRDDVWNMCKEIFDSIIPEGNAISLHVRRTDHLVKSSFHPVLPLSYYEEALSKFDKSLPVLVFSDDPKWCNEQEFFGDDRFLISEGGDNITDMCMMSMCQYQIIANSTFSWWGAWLSKSENVIAPKLWFGPDGEDPTDIYVDRWEYLDV
jgi:hypothetical protein